MEYNEPDNYQQIRESMVVLMQDLKRVNDGLRKLDDNPLLNEFYEEQIKGAKLKIIDVINLLGEMHGMTLADDIIENKV